MHDLRFTFRRLLKHPGFTAVAVLSPAFGIGATVLACRLPARRAGRIDPMKAVRYE